jgi:hypothetical protein
MGIVTFKTLSLEDLVAASEAIVIAERLQHHEQRSKPTAGLNSHTYDVFKIKVCRSDSF